MKMCDVFISYRRSDGEEVAKALCNYLREGGLRVFLDTSDELGIEIGSAFPDQLKQAIEMAAHYVLIASPDAVKERTGEDWVFEEINTAYDLFNNSKGETTDRSFSILKTDENVVLPKIIEKLHFLCVGETEDKKIEAFKEIFDLATKVNKKNLWYAAHRWLEKATGNRGRFASLNISETIMPNVNNKGINVSLPINIFDKDTENSAQESLLEALKKSKSNIMLVGEGGAGKTTALVHIMKRAYEDEYTNDSQIPIFVDLSYAPDTNGNFYSSGRPSFIRRSIYRQLCQGRLDEVNKNELEYINRIFSKIPEDMINSITSLLTDKKEDGEPEYLLLLDGLNEVSTTKIEGLGESAMQMVLKEIEYLIKDCPNVRLVITSRSQTNDLENTQELALCGVNDDAIIQYLEEVSANEKIEHVMNNKQLKEVLKNPLFLTLYASGDVADDVLSAGEILHSFFTVRQQKLNADIEYNMGRESGYNQNRFTQEMKNFILDFIIPEIAWTMEKENKFNLYEDEFEDIIKNFFDKKGESEILGKFAKQIFAYNRKNTSRIAEEFVWIYSEIDSLTSAILDCCVNALGVLQLERPSYSFIHQHIRDFFAAQKNINELRLAAYLASERGKFNEALNSLVEFNKEPVNIDVRRFMGEALGEHRNKPNLSDGIWHSNVPKETCDRNLIKRAFSAYRNKFDGECGYGIYNLITILKEIRKDLSGEDFSYLDMKYCNLNGTILGRPGLLTKFDGALINNYTFMPWGYKSHFDSIAISPDEKTFATYEKNGVVKFWSIATFSLVKETRLEIDSEYEGHIRLFLFDKKGNNVIIVINYYEPGDPIDNEPIEVKKIENFLIHMENFEVETIENLDGIDYNLEALPLFLYKGVEVGCFTTKEPLDFGDFSNFVDLKKVENGECFGYQEYQNLNGKLSLCRFHNGLALYDISSGALINKYYWDFYNIDVTVDHLKVFFFKKNILVICDNKLTLFDFELNFIVQNEIDALDIFDHTIVSDKYIFMRTYSGKIIVLSLDALVVLGEIDASEDFVYSVYFTNDGNTLFFNTTADMGFVYDLNKNQVIDFVETVSSTDDLDLVRLLNVDIEGLTDNIQYLYFSKRSPEELSSITGLNRLHLKKENKTPNNKNNLYLSVLNKNDYEADITLWNSDMELLGTIEGVDAEVKTILTCDNKKVVTLSRSGTLLSFMDVESLLAKKTVSFEEFHKIDVPCYYTSWFGSGKRIFAAPDDTIATTMGNKMDFWDLDKKSLCKQIEHIGGLYIIDVNLNKLHPQSELSEDTKQKLRQYGAKV